MVKRSIGLVLIALLMGGCVVETSNSSLERNRDIGKAVDAYIAAGMIYLKDGDFAMADLKFQKAYALDNDSAEANNALALFYSIGGETEEIEKHYKKAISVKSNYSAARNNYASFLFDQGRYKEARDQLLVVVKDYNYAQRTKSLESLGYCYLNLGDEKNAERYFLRALQRDAKMGRSILELAEINFNRGNYKFSERYLARFDQLSAPNPRHLWLAIRLQRILKDKHKLSSFELALRNMFPESAEYKAYMTSKEALTEQATVEPASVQSAPVMNPTITP